MDGAASARQSLPSRTSRCEVRLGIHHAPGPQRLDSTNEGYGEKGQVLRVGDIVTFCMETEGTQYFLSGDGILDSVPRVRVGRRVCLVISCRPSLTSAAAVAIVAYGLRNMQCFRTVATAAFP